MSFVRGVACLVAVAAAAVAAVLACAQPAVAFSPNGDQGWYWQMPVPAGGSGMFLDVSFPTATDAWAVGPAGSILQSSDGGERWTTQASGSDASLGSVQFLDARYGWACGGGGSAGTGDGVILRTVDGGEHWTVVSPPTLAETPTNVSFVDARRGWIGTREGGVYRTRDGGATWRRFAVGRCAKPVHVDFVTRYRGWAACGDGTIMRTVDAGRTWRRQRSGMGRNGAVYEIDFHDRLHGWALAYINGDEWTTCVLATRNGGRTWRRVWSSDSDWLSGLVATGPFGACVLDGSWTSMIDAFYGSAFVGYFAGLPLPSTCMRTIDGGRRRRTTTFTSPVSPGGLARQGRRLCAVGAGVVLSDDDGRHWRAASFANQYSFVAAQASVTGELWAVDSRGALVHSTDGVRWKERAAPTRWAHGLNGMCFVDAGRGWLVGEADDLGEGGLILHTTDGGASWVEQESRLSGALLDVDFVDADNGWSAAADTWGWEGADLPVQRTFDGGHTWIPLYVAREAAGTCVDFIDTERGWLGGTYEKRAAGDEAITVPAVFATGNGGLLWSTQSLPEGAPVPLDIQFVDAHRGWLVGTDDEVGEGWLLRTTDGGSTWSRVTLPRDDALYAVHFLDATRGWAGGDGLWATGDGGATWRKVAAGDIRAIAALAGDRVWGFGTGTLISTVDGAGDLTPPTTLDDGDWTWHRSAVTLRFSAADAGGSGVARTEHSTDGGRTWRTGASLTFAAPATHAQDGVHEVLYRSVDGAGNAEATERAPVLIDTLGPKVGAPKRGLARAGRRGIVYFTAGDATSGVARVTVRIRDRRGRLVRTLRCGPGNWSQEPAPPYYWLRFRCSLKPGTYRVEVRAVDAAGNRQQRVARTTLRVRRTGSEPRPPDWWEGLPYETPGGVDATLRAVASARAGDRPASGPEVPAGPWQAAFGRLFTSPR